MTHFQFAGHLNGNTLLTSIPAGGSDTFTVQMLTSSTGVKSGQISVSNNDSNEHPYNFAITGTVLAPEINVLGSGGTTIADGDTTPATGDGTNFGSVKLGGRVTTRTFTVTNSGSGTLTLSKPQLPVGFVVGPDLLVTSIASGASDTFSVQIQTSLTGTKSGQIVIPNNDSNESPYNFSITGKVN